jgi:hypothetical protein
VTELFGEGFSAFNPGWTKQIVTTHYKDFHDDPFDESLTTRSIPWKVVTQNYALDDTTRLPMMVSRETQEDLYSYNFRVKMGYNKTIEARVQLPYGFAPWDVGNVGLSLEKTLPVIKVIEEINRILWVPSIYNPNELAKTYEKTTQAGLILYEGEYTVTDYGHSNIQLDTKVTSAVPILQASLNRQVQSNNFEGILWGPITTIVEYGRDTGTNQIDLHRSETNHLIPQTSYSKTIQNIADRSIEIDELQTIQMFIRDKDKEKFWSDRGLGAFQPAEVNAGDVPYKLSLPVAKRRLKRRSATPDVIEIQLPYFDAGLRRGSVRRVYDRLGNSQMYLVLGYNIEVKGLDGQNPKVYQTFQAVKVQNA